MATFTIDSENNIVVHTGPPTGAGESQSFSTARELAKLTAEWPASRLVETWNSFAGIAAFDDLKPVNKFTDRKAGVARIWKAIQRLSPDVAQPAMTVRTTKSSRRARAPKHATESRSNKKAEAIAMMKRTNGATLDEIMEATGWQKHTVRGFVSMLGSKGGEKVESSKNAGGERTYKIAK